MLFNPSLVVYHILYIKQGFLHQAKLKMYQAFIFFQGCMGRRRLARNCSGFYCPMTKGILLLLS